MKVLMVCSGGMSSTIVVQALEKEAKVREFPLDILATGIEGVEDELHRESYDVLLVAPQVKHLLNRFTGYAEETNTKLLLIQPMWYTPFGAVKIFDALLAL